MEENVQQTTLRDTLNAAVDEHIADPVETTDAPVADAPAAEPAASERSRDEAGRYAKEPKAKDPAAAAPAAPALKPRPQSWKKDFDEHWGKLDPLLQDYIHQREGEYAKGVSTYKTEAERAKPILDALTPYAQQFQQYNLRPEQLIQNMMLRHQALSAPDPQMKWQTWLALGRDYGLPVQQIMQAMQRPQVDANGQPIPQAQYTQPDPRLQMLTQQMQNMHSQFTNWRSEQERQQMDQIGKDIDFFSRDGKHPHFETVRGTMGDLMDKGLAQTLEEAYSLALRMPQHDDIRTAMEEETRKAAEAARAKEAAEKAAAAKRRAVQPRSATPGSAAGAPSEGKKSIRESLSEAYEASSGRV